ncbi:hypothetical protein [Lysinibacillus xylanilyticus]|uniref:Uncharacterized protein n=1 Tax=Lysinibacillus xylanilyticus TaxID=582475 RepID=A0ABT4EP28_9BACI|nr:hypothetical protein [Lysinibacillus xylanilyticus]MCY9547417.1 hypothetical protein [Lysinibacillus xylanilyticus]
MAHHHNVVLISVPTACFAADAFAQLKHLLLSLRFRTEQSFLGASGQPSAAGCFLRESVVLTQRQQQDVGHEGVITGRDGFSPRSSIAGPQGVAQSPLQSTYIHDTVLTNVILNFFLNFTNVKI